MQQLNFGSLKNRYKLLKDQDTTFLNNFFNDFKILEILKKIEKKRKKYLLIIIIAFIISVSLIILVLNIPELNHTNSDWDSIAWYIVSWIFLIFMILFGTLKSRFSSDIKWKVLSKLVEKLDNDVEYNSSWTFFKDDFKLIQKETKLIKPYDRFDWKEDSIKIDWKEKWYLITWTEFQTSTKSTDKKWRTHYTTNNHGYIMKIQFENPKFQIEKSITLFEQWNMLVWIIFYIITFCILLWLALSFWKIFWVLFWVYIIVLIWIYFYKKNKSKNRVNLENIEFEKEFDVYCDDQILARQILTPAFMYRIYDYVNKINKKRKYSLYMKDDYMYIKHKIEWEFLEISFFKSLFKNLQDYVEYYLEIKNIWELAKDLKLSFYDKWFSVNNIIK